MIVLVAGGSGLIGSRLCNMLDAQGHEVRILSRSNKRKNKFTYYYWNPSKKEVDPKALTNVSAVINLAGAGIADHRWTDNYKKEILQSRLDAVATLLNAIQSNPQITVYAGASALGYYGNRGDELMDESSPAGETFLARTTRSWEAASDNCPVRKVLIRTGIVLTKKGGALPPLARPVKAMIAPVIDGKQYMSWIHIEDVCNMYIEAILNHSWSGVYNAVNPEAIRHGEFVNTLKKVLNPNAITIRVPPGFIRFLLGEQSALILDSTRVRPLRAMESGYKFHFSDLETALRNIYGL